jgi:hypothetical protein
MTPLSLTARTRGADETDMANHDHAGSTEDGSSGEERSMTKRMLDLINRFDAEDRRSPAKPEAGDPMHRRRRDDTPARSCTRADDLIVEPAQPE